MRAPIRSAVGVFCLLFALPAGALNFEVPDSRVNAVTGRIEIADVVWSGSSYDVRYIINSGALGTPETFVVSSSPLDDRRPRIVIAPNGDAWVVWWRDDVIDRVLARKRTQSTGLWSSESTMSLPGVSSRNPHVAYDGSRVWIAFEESSTAGTAVAACGIQDEPDPVGLPVALATVTTPGPNGCDSRVHAEAGKLWVTWIDTPTAVGWCKYDYSSGVWTAPAYESYAGTDVPGAREKVRSAVLGN